VRKKRREGRKKRETAFLSFWELSLFALFFSTEGSRRRFFFFVLVTRCFEREIAFRRESVLFYLLCSLRLSF